MEYVIGCDIGSQSLKAILLSHEGQLAGEVSVSYPIDYPHPTWAEQSAEKWFGAFIEAVRFLLARQALQPAQIRGISLASQVDGVVAMDASGAPLYPAIIWMDRRAVEQCAQVAQKTSQDRLLDLSGLNLDASHVAPKINWLRDHQPDAYRRAQHFLLPGSYLAYQLTGELGVDYSNASSTLLMDVRRKDWSPELCELFEIDPRQLAPVLPATQVLGVLRGQVAAESGLASGTPVVLGSGDEHAACLGAGVILPGLVCDIAGTAEPVCAASSEPLFDPAGLVETHCHAHPDLWLIENPGFASGANYRWFRDQFAAAEIQEAVEAGANPYDLLNNLAASIPPGSQGLILLPCLMGAMAPTWNPLARGTYFGFTLAHTRAHFVRALLEASAYAVRDITDQMRHIGLPIHQIQVVGGGARSRLWRQIKADVTGLPVALPQTIETTALGAAMLALVGVGLCPSLEEAARQAVRIVEVRDPHSETQACYEEYYQLYRATYHALLPVFDQAARIQTNPPQTQ
jgi:xylulokinase